MARRNYTGDGGRWGFLRMIGLGTAAVGASSVFTACASGGLNGSHNQAGPRLEPSHIFHFKGRVARCADFVGSGVSDSGERLPFGLATTDNSFMDGECWTSQRRVRIGAWAEANGKYYSS